MNVQLLKHRFGLSAILFFLVIAISTLTRIALLIKSYDEFEFSLLNLAGVFGFGLFYDAVNAGYFVLPFLLYLWILPVKLFQRQSHRFILYPFFIASIFLLLFNAAGEWFFWDEFNARFNFIAVDYLVYTAEVVGNIRQSYPIEWILIGLIVVSTLSVYLLKPLIKQSSNCNMRFRHRTAWFAGCVTISLFSLTFVSNKFHHFSLDANVNELAGNGMYELFAAYRNNELSYEQFYPRVDVQEAFSEIHKLLKTNNSVFKSNEAFSIERKIDDLGSEKRLHVILISIESFSASFMRTFGNEKNLTPFMDSLAQHSFVYTNVYATGTRTVRGLEALSLCVPPTPGQSIVRRPSNEKLFSLAGVFNQKGYESKFIYGGYGYFDNMSYFFENNGYQVVDRSALLENEIDYENIWGVADENLFTLSLGEIDKTVNSGKPIFAHIMTTSNHRPFTYPDGRIDIPSHTSRAGAVKYTDYALRKFIQEASRRSWYSNTVFVITADHCASSAGKSELPVEKYHIPLLVFSPGNIEPIVQDRLMSQIDIGPTVLGMLNFSYTSKFFGQDINSIPDGDERAFISTYQLLGYMKRDSLVVLAPNKSPEVFLVSRDHVTSSKIPKNKTLSGISNEAIAWYEASSYSFTHGLMKAWR